MGSFFDAIAADVRLPAQIAENIQEDIQTLEKNVHTEITNLQGGLQGFGRGVIKGFDNARGDLLYTVRDTKDQFLIGADNALDQLALVVDRQASNFMDLLQMATLLGISSVALFLILYGDKVFKNGIQIGRLNLI